jgi:hypothetical protein
MEQSHAAKDAIAQILINSRMCAEGHRPICQDTGIVTAFIKVGMEVKWQPGIAGMMTMQEMVDEGVREAWRNADNVLRPSILEDPAFTRRNTGDNTPAMVVVELVEGGEVDVTVASKGGGSEAKSKFAMLNPSTPSSTGCSTPCPAWAQAGVPRHARHRHRRHRQKSDGHGQGSPCGPHRHAGTHRPQRKARSNCCASRSQQGQPPRHQTQASAVLPLSSTLKIMGFPTRRICRRHDPQLPPPTALQTRWLRPVMVAPPPLDAAEARVTSTPRRWTSTRHREGVKTWKPAGFFCSPVNS